MNLIESAERYLMEDDAPWDHFTSSYLEAALWSSTDDEGEPLDAKYSVNDIAEETMKKIVDDCKKFKEEFEMLYFDVGWTDEQAGHDFWLTRNHHGAGFWDRSQGYNQEIGKQLTDKAHAFGEVDLYVGDDNKIHA